MDFIVCSSLRRFFCGKRAAGDSEDGKRDVCRAFKPVQPLQISGDPCERMGTFYSRFSEEAELLFISVDEQLHGNRPGLSWALPFYAGIGGGTAPGGFPSAGRVWGRPLIFLLPHAPVDALSGCMERGIVLLISQALLAGGYAASGRGCDGKIRFEGVGKNSAAVPLGMRGGMLPGYLDHENFSSVFSLKVLP